MIKWLFKILYRKYKRLLIRENLKSIERCALPFINYYKERIDKIRNSYNDYSYRPTYYFIKGDKKYKTEVGDLVFIIKEYCSYFTSKERELLPWVQWLIYSFFHTILIILLIIDHSWAKIHKREVVYMNCAYDFRFNMKMLSYGFFKRNKIRYIN